MKRRKKHVPLRPAKSRTGIVDGSRVYYVWLQQTSDPIEYMTEEGGQPTDTRCTVNAVSLVLKKYCLHTAAVISYSEILITKQW